MNSKPKQISFLEFLIDENESQDDSLGEVIFPKGFEVRDLENLRKEFEILANRYGLSLPAKLKKGNLVLEWSLYQGKSKIIMIRNLKKLNISLRFQI